MVFGQATNILFLERERVGFDIACLNKQVDLIFENGQHSGSSMNEKN